MGVYVYLLGCLCILGSFSNVYTLAFIRFTIGFAILLSNYDCKCMQQYTSFPHFLLEIQAASMATSWLDS
ncbi:hypothetical protein AG1IA_03135 [Rhizoctonia solani AG-1 IA]|uniref:Uncharacterized protein n=1 Tax=Thanatephorus cucumeris (strain AG1-IA) TaxID=983506 RepID=L8X177_THACA|nr:hypothetical protein AG1IA_03135 [Rhizoctonia solani AG-1 IA]